ncbi:alpha-tectorin-like isoform X2 [Puntigrus tetrazona]|uniref:alpha-tectorin-like isoform X2 n=1 Tax=Puntigrus tetrazona TaxID=1606681 RepID=UPI001C88E898|nr:alpha-tectorin-like isoform X2 [Puntigrus tetrazona]
MTRDSGYKKEKFVFKKLPANFLPFGQGDTVNPISDDGSSQAIQLQHPFKYFGRTYNQIYVNNNGHLTFTRALSAYVPYLNAGLDIIAPLWTDLYNVNGGTISYREDTSSAVLTQVTQAVNQYFPRVPFTASSAFVATWNQVPYITGGGDVTFQVVLVSNGVRSFVLINYGDIAQTSQSWLARYDTVDSIDSFTIPAASPPELSSSSNINVNGRWSFHVDRSARLPDNFLPFGHGDTVNPISDDGSSQAINLQQPFKYFGRTYNQIYVNNNGHLTFTRALSAFVPYRNAGLDIIAPLWTDLFNVNGGTISYREDTSSAVLTQVTQTVNQYFPRVPFTATSAFVATWDQVPYITGGGDVTFQVVLVSNGVRSFVLMNYGDIAETSQTWLAGYDTVDSIDSFSISAASPPELSSSSNINVNGRWSFRVDRSARLPANFLPFGHGDIVNPISDDGSSQAIDLQHPFKYFGRTYNQIYVNNNGHLTFTRALSAYIPYLNAGLDIIAPLWTDLYNVNGGTISYREDTSSAVLTQVTQAVNQNYPNMRFTATSAFVATWDSVPYFSHEGEVTFQVVLVFSGRLSFILFNYVDIAQTGQIWKAGYDTVDSDNSFRIPAASPPELSSSSNINVNGRWLLHVDGSEYFCGSCTANEACQERSGVYGCTCLNEQTSNPEQFDAVESCASSTGTMSLSRCQLFDSGFIPENLHLNNPSCKGTIDNGRLLFNFDNEDHICGTTLTNNRTHFIYQNAIQSNLRNHDHSIISRERWMNITFSCAYPLIQTLSMPMGIIAESSVISQEIPGQGTYQIRMIPYHDAEFTSPYEGEVEIQVNQQIYVAVEVEGVDPNQIATVLDNCWATPVNDANNDIRWSLIIRECPNPDDGTVEVLQNGNGIASHFSFRMFTFSGSSDRIFLHCQIHLCLVMNGRCAQSCEVGNRRRRRRSLDFQHSAAITMGL